MATRWPPARWQLNFLRACLPRSNSRPQTDGTPTRLHVRMPAACATTLCYPAVTPMRERREGRKRRCPRRQGLAPGPMTRARAQRLGVARRRWASAGAAALQISDGHLIVAHVRARVRVEASRRAPPRAKACSAGRLEDRPARAAFARQRKQLPARLGYPLFRKREPASELSPGLTDREG